MLLKGNERLFGLIIKHARTVENKNMQVVLPFRYANKYSPIRIRVGPQVEKSPNLHITRDSTGSIHENVRGKKFDPKKVRLGWGDLI